MQSFSFLRSGAAAAAVLLLALPAAAQERAALEFLQIFNVGGPDTTLTTQRGTEGSVGCGGGDGGTLISFLNEAQGTDITDSQLPVEQRRALYRFCDELTSVDSLGWTDVNVVGSAAEVLRRMEGLAPDELFMQTDQAAALTGIQINNIGQRIAQIRFARRGLDPGGYAFERGQGGAPTVSLDDAFGLRASAQDVGKGAFAAALAQGFTSGSGLFGLEGLSAFVNGQYTHLDADSSSREVGSDGDGGGLTLGVDLQLGEAAFLGLAFGYSRLHTDFDHGYGESDLDDFTFSTYGSAFFGEHVYVDGIVSGSILRFDQERSIPTPGPSFEDLDSDPEGWNLTGDLGVGGQLRLDPVDLNPYLRVAVAYTEVDSFDESGSTLALSLDGQDNTSVTSTLGLSVALPISTGFGVVSPYLRGEYVHEYADQADDLRGHLRLIPEASFDLDPTNTDRDYGDLGAGVTLTLPGGFSAFADYDVLVGFSNLVVHEATLGGRIEF